MKKPLLFIATLILIFIAIGCHSELPMTPVPAHQVETYAIFDKDSYLAGEDIIIEFSFKNPYNQVFQMEPFPPRVYISPVRDYGGTHTTYSPACRFPEGTETRSINPGEVAIYSLTWDQRDDDGQQVPYGYYSVSPGYIRVDDHLFTLHLKAPVRILILPAEGAMEKTIEVNQSQTENGITITLERVEMSALETTIYALITLPDYSPTQTGDLYLEAGAEYSVDGVAMIGPVEAETRPLEDRVELTWGQLAPVPKGARELIFTVFELHFEDERWEGSLEFNIPLE